MTTEICFSIEPTNKTVALGFEVWLNNVLHFDSDHVDQPTTISVPVDDTVDAEHILKFVLKNKLPEHTQLSESGEIIDDAVIKITNILFDQIPMDSIFLQQAQYTHDFNGTQPIIQDKFFDCMGCNGTVELKFTTPIYIWLLEHM
jgi:hypothetical protein